MLTAAIIGAGDLGGASARSLAAADLVRQILIVDESGSVAAGKALDIRQSGPIERFDTRVEGTDRLAEIAGASVVILGDAVGRGEWLGDGGLAAIRQIVAVVPDAPIVCAGPGARDVITLAVRELRLPAARIVGSAPLAAASAARALTALELDASARDVTLTLAGAPPAWILGWAHATLAGTPLDRLLPPVALMRIERRLTAGWPPGPYALASAAAAVVKAILTRGRGRLPCFVARRASGRDIVAALPVSLGRAGVIEVHEPALTPRERVALDTLFTA